MSELNKALGDISNIRMQWPGAQIFGVTVRRRWRQQAFWRWRLRRRSGCGCPVQPDVLRPTWQPGLRQR